MIPRLLFSPEALADLEQAADWYGSKSEPIRVAFLSNLDLLFDRILAFPTSAPIHRDKIRRALMGKFPYGVFFVVDEVSVKILAVMHLKRNPRTQA